MADYSRGVPQQQAPVVIAAPPVSNNGFYLNPDHPVVLPALPGGTNPTTALEYLKTVTTLNVQQKVELVELVTGFDTSNRYTVFNERGQPVFYAIEDADCCARFCFGPARPFEIRILDLYQNEIIHMSRPLACQSCCFPCCLMSCEVTSPPGTVVGSIEQKWSICIPEYYVKDATGEVILRIRGPCWTCSCGGDVVFKVLSKDGETEVGNISKKWSGLVQEYFTNADNFSVSFPQDLDVRVKATMLAGVFLIDAMYFERKQQKSLLEQAMS